MQVTIQEKPATIVTIPRQRLVDASSIGQTVDVAFNQIKGVNISDAEVGDVLMFSGTSWQSESLDGGEFN